MASKGHFLTQIPHPESEKEERQVRRRIKEIEKDVTSASAAAF